MQYDLNQLVSVFEGYQRWDPKIQLFFHEDGGIVYLNQTPLIEVKDNNVTRIYFENINYSVSVEEPHQQQVNELFVNYFNGQRFNVDKTHYATLEYYEEQERNLLGVIERGKQDGDNLKSRKIALEEALEIAQEPLHALKDALKACMHQIGEIRNQIQYLTARGKAIQAEDEQILHNVKITEAANALAQDELMRLIEQIPESHLRARQMAEGNEELFNLYRQHRKNVIRIGNQIEEIALRQVSTVISWYPLLHRIFAFGLLQLNNRLLWPLAIFIGIYFGTIVGMAAYACEVFLKAFFAN